LGVLGNQGASGTNQTSQFRGSSDPIEEYKGPNTGNGSSTQAVFETYTDFQNFIDDFEKVFRDTISIEDMEEDEHADKYEAL